MATLVSMQDIYSSFCNIGVVASAIAMSRRSTVCSKKLVVLVLAEVFNRTMQQNIIFLLKSLKVAARFLHQYEIYHDHIQMSPDSNFASHRAYPKNAK
jgi:hypothetical protein